MPGQLQWVGWGKKNFLFRGLLSRFIWLFFFSFGFFIYAVSVVIDLAVCVRVRASMRVSVVSGLKYCHPYFIYFSV